METHKASSHIDELKWIILLLLLLLVFILVGYSLADNGTKKPANPQPGTKVKQVQKYPGSASAPFLNAQA